jgi:hypothetical protein
VDSRQRLLRKKTKQVDFATSPSAAGHLLTYFLDQDTLLDEKERQIRQLKQELRMRRKQDAGDHYQNKEDGQSYLIITRFN